MYFPDVILFQFMKKNFMHITFPIYDNFSCSAYSLYFFLNIKIYCHNQVLIIPCGYRKYQIFFKLPIIYLFEKIK